MLNKEEATAEVKKLLREIADKECFDLEYNVGWYVEFADDWHITIEALKDTVKED